MTRAFIFGCLLAGCVSIGDDVGDVDTGVSEQAGTSSNGTSTNGISINGISINGISINGISINGISINGISINGISINGVSASGGQITGVDAGGTPLAGADLVGARFTASRTDGGTVELRIDDAALITADAWGYVVSQSVDGATWTPLCPGAYDGRALVIAGRWDYRSDVVGAGGWIDDPASFTFGCRRAAIAKCIELGYRPWAVAGTTSLRAHHIACVRMIRGDYCGDGHAWTTDGNLINVYDGLTVQTDTNDWPLDALWSKDKATCAQKTRSTNGRPSCFDNLSGCSNVRFNTTVLLADEYESNAQTSSSGGKPLMVKVR
jgi:hypothetical protein